MVEESDALARIFSHARRLGDVEASLVESTDRFLAQTLRATQALPGFNNSTMDGYAIRSEDGLAERQIIGEQPAGKDRLLEVGINQAVRIFTGAPIPVNATAVVMQEDVDAKEGRLSLRELVSLGENIRRTGADLAVGQLVAQTGQKISAQLVGLFASQGLRAIRVFRAPKITIISTGDELKPADSSLSPGEIYDSNSYMLASYLRLLGIDASLRHCGDDRMQLESEIRNALDSSDVLILSGGVSVGDHDHVRAILTSVGVSLDLWRVRMKPGKPLAFGHVGEKLVFGLPGNPVSAAVTFLVLVRPALLQMMGADGEDRFLPRISVRLHSIFSNPGDRPHYIRGRVSGGSFERIGLQESHALFGLSQSNALLRLDAGSEMASGAQCEVLSLA